MRWQLIATAIRMSFLELRRSRLTIVLLVLVPSIFFVLVVLTAADRTIEFSLPAIGDNKTVTVSEKHESIVFIGQAAVGFMAAFFALNLLRKRRDFDRRLVLCGYRASEHMAAKLAVVTTMVVLVSLYTALLFSFIFTPKSFLWMLGGLLLGGGLYASYGLLISAFVRGDLEGLLLIIMLANVDLGWLQNPIYYTGAKNATIIHLLPGYYPTQVAIAGSFTDLSCLEPFLYGLAYACLMSASALVIYRQSIRIHSSSTL